MQAIHMAALAGHSAVVDALIKTYCVDPTIFVSSCFLLM